MDQVGLSESDWNKETVLETVKYSVLNGTHSWNKKVLKLKKHIVENQGAVWRHVILVKSGRALIF